MSSSPESSSSPDTGPVEVADLLDDAQESLVNERKAVTENPKAAADLTKVSLSERMYIEAETQRIVTGIDADRLSNPEMTKQEIMAAAADRLVTGRLRLATEEANQMEDVKTKENRHWLVRAMHNYRHSTKLRVAIGVGAAAAATGLAISGLWMPALGVRVASGMLRGTAAGIGAKEFMDRRAERKDTAGKVKAGEINAGDAHIPDLDADHMKVEAERLAGGSFNDVMRMLVRLESPYAKQGRSEEDQAKAEQWAEALRTAERDRIESQFRMVLEQRNAEGKKIYFKKDLPEAMRSTIHAEISQALAARRGQIVEDRETIKQSTRSKRLRTGVAVLVGTAVGSTGVLGILTHGAEHAHHVAHARHAGHAASLHQRGPGAPGRPNVPPAEHGGPTPPEKPKLESFNYTAAHENDSYWTAGESAAHQVAKEIPEARHFNHLQQLILNDYYDKWLLHEHHGNSTVLLNAKIKIPKHVLAEGVKYVVTNYKNVR